MSVYAENITKQSGQRLYFDQKPRGEDLGHIFAYASEPGYKTFDQVRPEYGAYDKALNNFIDAALSEPAPPVDTGNYGLLLSEPLGAQIAGAASMAEWYERRVKDTFVPITARDQMNELRYAKRRCVFSMPEYVAGLQFDTVYLIHVDEVDFDDRIRGSGFQRRYISRCYVGASRASKKLVISSSHERGGPSRILAGPMTGGSLQVDDRARTGTSRQSNPARSRP